MSRQGGGSPLRGAERAAGLAFARAWRIANKPWFDALYGPERQRRTCAVCRGTGFAETADA